VFLGRHCGLVSFGVAAPPLYQYTFSALWKNRGREVLARVKAYLEVYVLGID
jgi:vancomycin permeability regulator SanA